MIRAPLLGGCALLLALLPPCPADLGPADLGPADLGWQKGKNKNSAKKSKKSKASGLLVYCEKNGKRWVLLGHGRRGSWEILGGHSESRKSLSLGVRDETPLETAAREGFEESRMQIPYHEILQKARRLGTSRTFTMFAMETAYIPRKRFMEAFIPVDWKTYDEMDDYAWVEWRALLSEVRRSKKASDLHLTDIDGKREIRGLRPGLFRPLKKLAKIWELFLGDPDK